MKQVRDLLHAEPLQLDPVDQPIDGTQIEVGERSGWWTVGTPLRLAIEVRALKRTERPDGLPDLAQIATLGAFRTEAFGVPVALLHDSRMDPQDHTTAYSNTAFGFQHYEAMKIELS